MAIAEYLASIKKNLAHGDATEHTHRPALKALIESLDSGLIATNEPKRIACGAPDFNISRKTVPLGYIETKDVDDGLDEMQKGRGPNADQFKRYRDGLPNWILTDYLDFYWYVAGEMRLNATLAATDKKGKLVPIAGGEEELKRLLDAFFKQPALTVETAKDLAKRMAGMTRIVRELIVGTFEQPGNDKKQLETWLASFREVLIPDLDQTKFADMFAQTLAYGLFASRVNTLSSDQPFTREMAAFNLPKTNPFLRKLFAEMAGVNMPDTFGWAVDDIVELLKHANFGKILKDFGHASGKQDPVVHFYETFLAAYDPKLREVRGVYFTPEPVVSYIVRSLDGVLRSRFGKSKGLADEKTLILDPAVGTATFLFFVIQQIYSRFKKQLGAWDGYVSEHLLGRLFGFELLMAPYSVAHLKLAMELQETGYKFQSEQRLGIYLTNTLEEAAKRSEELFAQWVADEANEAADIKSSKPILVVLGNPPYSGHSANRSQIERVLEAGESYSVVKGGPLKSQKTVVKKVASKRMTVTEKTFIGKLMEDYYYVDGMPLGEKNPKWLQDDYVKFIRFAQWRISRTGHGVLGFITNHGYLDNPTFPGMRRSLMESFTDIYVYDLHGNSKKKEQSPDGGKDENVFDIQQGVCILLAIKEPDRTGEARVHHADLWGSRSEKYIKLEDKSLETTEWALLTPTSPNYLFIPQSGNLAAEYDLCFKLTDAMPVNVLGFQSHRDPFAISFERKTVVDRMSRLLPSEETDDDLRAEFGLADNRDWQLARARNELRNDQNWDSHIARVMYRPLDWRWCHYSTVTMDYPRRELLQNMLGRENLALNVTRQTRASVWQHAVVSNTPAPAVFVELKDGSNVFPLYLYGDSRQHTFYAERRANFSEAFIARVTSNLGGLQWVEQGRGNRKDTVGAEDIFDYMYGILNAPGFRSRYSEFLKRDFARVPLTSSPQLFFDVAGKGRELISVHLMESPSLEALSTGFPVKGNNLVEKVSYAESDHRVWINAQQYFSEVPVGIWNSKIGGYQVCNQWLKDRKGRTLTYEDTQHWQRIIVALSETKRLMEEIDDLIPRWPLP